MDETVLGIIPARSGSKGVENKNIRDVAGKPLMHYTIEDAAGSEHLSDYLVSTDSKKYASTARDIGAPVPFLRPKELATDEASSLGVIQHATAEYESQNDVKVDLIVLLQPTSPLRKSADIDEAIELFRDSDAQSLVSCYPTKEAHPNYLYQAKDDFRLESLRNQNEIPNRRQEHDPVFLINGAIYISTRELIFEEDQIHTNTPVGYQMPRNRSVNIDEPFDLELAEFFVDRITSGQSR